MSDEIVLHGHVFSWPTHKVALMLEMLGAPYRYRHVDLRSGEGRTPEYRAISRFGQVPAIVDGDFALAQSNAILAYLAERFGRFGGGNPVERHRIAEWLCWEADALYAVARLRSQIHIMKSPPEVVAATRRQAERALAAWDEQLAARPFCVGREPTIADVACYPYAANVAEAELTLDAAPNVRAWLDRMNGMPRVRNPATFLPRG